MKQSVKTNHSTAACPAPAELANYDVSNHHHLNCTSPWTDLQRGDPWQRTRQSLAVVFRFLRHVPWAQDCNTGGDTVCQRLQGCTVSLLFFWYGEAWW